MAYLTLQKGTPWDATNTAAVDDRTLLPLLWSALDRIKGRLLANGSRASGQGLIVPRRTWFGEPWMPLSLTGTAHPSADYTFPAMRTPWGAAQPRKPPHIDINPAPSLEACVGAAVPSSAIHRPCMVRISYKNYLQYCSHHVFHCNYCTCHVVAEWCCIHRSVKSKAPSGIYDKSRCTPWNDAFPRNGTRHLLLSTLYQCTQFITAWVYESIASQLNDPLQLNIGTA